MLGFIARTAVRATVRAAVRSHVEERAAARALAATPFALHPRAGGESALFEHRHVGFAHLVPGFPHPGTPTVSPIEHPHDAMLALYTLPICVRYHATRPQMHAASAQDFVNQLAQLYIGRRAAAPPQIRAAGAAPLGAWAAEAGALARYDLAQPDPFGADHEELVVIVRQAQAMAITYRYARAELHWVARAFFVSASNASFSFHGNRLHHAELWPQSTFLEPGVRANLLPHKLAEVPHLAAALAMPAADRETLSKTLESILDSEEPPWGPVDPARAVAGICAASPSPGLRQVVERQAYGVRSMHDLRGLALLLGRALETAATP